MLHKIVDERLLKANAVFELWPANTTNADDIEIYSETDANQLTAVLHYIRQQIQKPGTSE